MTKTRFAPLLIGLAFVSFAVAGCTDYSFVGEKYTTTEDGLEKTSGTRTAVDATTNKLYKINTTTDPSNVRVNDPLSTADTPRKTR